VTAKLKGRIPVINPDEIAEGLPLVEGHLDERQAGEIAVRERVRLLAERHDFAIETTLSGHSPIRFMAKAKAEGYKLTLIFVRIDSPELSQARVADRVAGGGHSVPLDAIIRRYPDTMSKLASAVEIADRSYILDNSDERRRLLMIHENGATRYLSRVLPEWIQAALPNSVQPDGPSLVEQTRLLQDKGWGR
jgi:predicted ABC-type ATPase